MDADMSFDAPWSLSLKLMTLASAAILLGVPLVGLFSGPPGNLVWVMSVVVLPLLVLLVGVLFMIRGYVLNGQQLQVQRLGWQSRLSLANLLSAEHDPAAMQRSIRLFGNGGLFCFAGTFRSRKLGTYRAFATAPRLAVVMKFADKTVVVTPGNPTRFVAALEKLIGERA